MQAQYAYCFYIVMQLLYLDMLMDRVMYLTSFLTHTEGIVIKLELFSSYRV